LFSFKVVPFFVLSFGWLDMAKLEETEMHRKVNVSHEQKGTDLFTLAVYSASSSYLKLEK
jgi:predicted KAP-like P-loop ATPase